MLPQIILIHRSLDSLLRKYELPVMPFKVQYAYILTLLCPIYDNLVSFNLINLKRDLKPRSTSWHFTYLRHPINILPCIFIQPWLHDGTFWILLFISMHRSHSYFPLIAGNSIIMLDQPNKRKLILDSYVDQSFHWDIRRVSFYLCDITE